MFFSFLISFLSLNLLGCSTASGELQVAQELEQSGDLTAAFDAYQSLRSKYPHTHVADLADERLLSMHFKHAKKVERENPQRAIQFYQAIEDKWKGRPEADLAKKHRLKIQSDLGLQEDNPTPVELIAKDAEIVQDAMVENSEEKEMCVDARVAQSRLIWQQYLTKYPNGKCVSEAEQFLNSTPARAKEIEVARDLGKKCFARMSEICTEYRIFQTTSDENACKNPSTALSREFQRLQKRKTAVLADNNQEFYQNLILPRWETLQSNKDEGCSEIQNFLKSSTQAGIDAIPLQKAIAENCAICFEAFTPMRD